MLPNFVVYDNKVAYDWPHIYTFSAKQNIAAIVWDYIQQAMTDCKIPTRQQPSKAEKIQWVITVEDIIKQYNNRELLSAEIADIWAQEGIEMYGLKGWALSTYYSKPELPSVAILIVGQAKILVEEMKLQSRMARNLIHMIIAILMYITRV